MGIVGERIRTLRLERGLSQSALARQAKVSQPVIAELEAGNQETTKRLPLIARALGVNVSDIDPSFFIPAEVAPVSIVHVRGSVQAGVWNEFDESQTDLMEFAPIVPGRYANLEKVAFRVRGESMTRARLFDGDYVIGVPYFMARSVITDGDLVVVERRRAGTTERTVKRIKVTGKECNLWPESDDPRFQSPIPCYGPEPDGTEIEITHYVIGSYTPR